MVARGAAPPPVLFVPDAAYLFGTAVEIVRLLTLMEHLPPLLVVGIGYRVATIKDALDLRSRDFTPTIETTDDSSAPAVMGGADRFLAFLRDELKPWVRERYGVDPDDSAFFGNSLAYENSEGDKRQAAQLPPDKRAEIEAEAEAHPWDGAADLERLVALLRGRGYPSLELECAVQPGEYHPTVPPLNLSRSLRYLFDAPR